MTKQRNDMPAINGGRPAGRRGKVRAATWVVLSLVTAAALTLGACAWWLPDRAPAILESAGEITSAPVGRQHYDGAQGVKVVPRLSAEQELRSNASGTVTEDATNGGASGLESGRLAMRVDDKPVVALATDVPLYRNLKSEDTGNDVRALNTELARLYPDIGVDAQSTRYHYATTLAVQRMMADAGASDDDGSLPLSKILWLPRMQVPVRQWRGGIGLTVSSGAPIGNVPGGIVGIDIKNGTPSNLPRTLTVLGQTTALPAGSTSVDDADFCGRVTQTQDFQTMLGSGMDLSIGLDASVRLAEPVQALRVPAAAVFGVKRGDGGGGGDVGCIAVPAGTGGSGASAGAPTVTHVNIVGADLGVSLIQTQDGSEPTQVRLGSVIKDLPCG